MNTQKKTSRGVKARVSSPTNDRISRLSISPPTADIITSSPVHRPSRLASVKREKEEAYRQGAFNFNFLHSSRDLPDNFDRPVELSQILELLEEKNEENSLHNTNRKALLTSYFSPSLAMNHEVLERLKVVLTCPLCGNLLRSDPAIISTCGHCYCFTCINRAIEYGSPPLTTTWLWRKYLPSYINKNNENEKESFTECNRNDGNQKNSKKRKRAPKKVSFCCPLCLIPAFKSMLIRIPLMRELCRKLHEVLPNLEKILYNLQEKNNNETGIKSGLWTSTEESPVALSVHEIALTEAESTQANINIENCRDDNDGNGKNRASFRKELSSSGMEDSHDLTFATKNENIEEYNTNSVSTPSQQNALQEKEDPPQASSEILSKVLCNDSNASPPSGNDNSLSLPLASANFTSCSLSLFPPPPQGKIRLVSPSSRIYFDDIDNKDEETSRVRLRRDYLHCGSNGLHRVPSGKITMEEKAACGIVDDHNKHNERGNFITEEQHHALTIGKDQQPLRFSLTSEGCDDSMLPFLAQRSLSNTHGENEVFELQKHETSVLENNNNLEEETNNGNNTKSPNGLKYGETKKPFIETREEVRHKPIESITPMRGINSNSNTIRNGGIDLKVRKGLSGERVLGAFYDSFVNSFSNSPLTQQSPNLPTLEPTMTKKNYQDNFSASKSGCLPKEEEEKKKTPRKEMVEGKESGPDTEEIKEKTNEMFPPKSTLTWNSYSSSRDNSISRGASTSTEQLNDENSRMSTTPPPVLHPGAFRYLLYNDTP
ncbi:unnamed protein product [Phytomonas sp. Hart1]|nr:unnamed protein product [Phytomonas sp. Hart1]|eukprot:CCW72288.1 unnamed protein product [Phytomonas sp. isolate Hart1]